MRELEPQQGNLLRMLLVYRLTTTEIGKQVGVNQATISCRLSAIQQELNQATQHCLREQRTRRREEYERLVRFIRSHLDASIERWLFEPASESVSIEQKSDDSQTSKQQLGAASETPNALTPRRRSTPACRSAFLLVRR